MPALLVKTHANPQRWLKALSQALPELEIRLWPSSDSISQSESAQLKNDVDYALVWNPQLDFFDDLDQLKAIFSIGAGVDHLHRELRLPDGVPVVRMVEETLTSGMTQYVLYQVLRFHRQFHVYEQQQRQAVWQVLTQQRPQQCRVGILGLGTLGEAVARQLVSLDFKVSGWSRSIKRVDGVQSYAGGSELSEFLSNLNIVVCLLPLTDETRNLIDARFLSQLPAGAFFINVARGGHVVESELLSALDRGHIAAAALDVFQTEPLPTENRLWSHPRVFITPHAAAQTGPETAAASIAQEIGRIENGQRPLHEVDMNRGY